MWWPSLLGCGCCLGAGAKAGATFQPLCSPKHLVPMLLTEQKCLKATAQSLGAAASINM